jgi:hypothetical protein
MGLSGVGKSPLATGICRSMIAQAAQHSFFSFNFRNSGAANKPGKIEGADLTNQVT